MLTNERARTAWDLLEVQEGGPLEKMFLLRELCQLQGLYYEQEDEAHQNFGHDFCYTMETIKKLAEEIPVDLEKMLTKVHVINP